MIKLIYGEKGTGKTKQIIDEANARIDVCHGNVVFITDKDKYMFSLKHKIRLINSTEYGIKTELGLLGFIRGLIAADRDIESLYIDGLIRMVSSDLSMLEDMFVQLEQIAEKANINVILTISSSVGNLPDFLKRFI